MKIPISYEQALEILKIPSDKIKMFIFIKAECPVCANFVPEIIIPEIEKSKDVDYYIIDTTKYKMAFPPVIYPSIYYYIPNSVEEMPITRFDGTTKEIFRNDLSNMIKLKQGMSIIEAFS